ncbi:hypothetical protein [Terrilactibacillus laevilacticus]|uniref:hypothetical protein n=1 Tax=Terrilactibacillus laevilacticus TaxID=1380157 RepID=UPI0015EFCE26|nr:hypothetical protein [Terrilactibacillus laevilacticus]
MGVFRRTGSASAGVATGRRDISLPQSPTDGKPKSIGPLRAVDPPPIFFEYSES